VCGIAGILGLSVRDSTSWLSEMADSLRHRGPDGGATWADNASGIGLAHRRLAILDLSPHGAQPMHSASGRFILSFNGEIYNHAELRAAIESRSGPITWRGHSDTEVLVEAIDRIGVQSTLEQCNGMFAFAVWDRQNRTLTLARDRMGEKPLYIGWVGGNLAFASELRALRCLPGWRHSVDQHALALLLRYGYVPAPYSIHTGIFKLPPASSISFTIEDASRPLECDDFISRTVRYWSLATVATTGISSPLQTDDDTTLDLLQTLLSDAVRLRMEADVPVGVLLSGGIDSSLIAALMQKASAKPIRTFTIGFREDRFDEARHARLVAAHLGSEHVDLHLTPSQALETVPRLPEVYDEPFADPSQLPTILVSALARKHVTVALSGDGGDELFFGYGRYRDALHTWRRIGNMPAVLRRALAIGLKSTGTSGKGDRNFRLQRLGHRIDARNFDAYYGNLLSLSLRVTAAQNWPNALPGNPDFPICMQNPGQRMKFADQSAYLPDDILTKTDRASMAASLELRVPLLDHRVVEFAWKLQERHLWDGECGKVILRRLLYQLLPRELVDRPKQGFDLPLDDWLRGSLREWMLDLLEPVALRSEGLLNEKTISSLVTEHLSGRGNYGYALWPTLMFESWRRRWEK
jgi:asparagine synthase (glutamine-hydrolysing)